MTQRLLFINMREKTMSLEVTPPKLLFSLTKQDVNGEKMTAGGIDDRTRSITRLLTSTTPSQIESESNFKLIDPLPLHGDGMKVRTDCFSNLGTVGLRFFFQTLQIPGMFI
jgi:hypothetical protein